MGGNFAAETSSRKGRKSGKSQEKKEHLSQENCPPSPVSSTINNPLGSSEKEWSHNKVPSTQTQVRSPEPRSKKVLRE